MPKRRCIGWNFPRSGIGESTNENRFRVRLWSEFPPQGLCCGRSDYLSLIITRPAPVRQHAQPERTRPPSFGLPDKENPGWRAAESTPDFRNGQHSCSAHPRLAKNHLTPPAPLASFQL